MNHSNLQYLSLHFSSCDDNGTIPKFIVSVNNLRYLDFSYSWLTCVINHELGNLSKFQHLDRMSNRWWEPSVVIWFMFFLRYLDLSGIRIDAPGIDKKSFIVRIPSIIFMHLASCNLCSYFWKFNFLPLFIPFISKKITSIHPFLIVLPT